MLQDHHVLLQGVRGEEFLGGVYAKVAYFGNRHSMAGCPSMIYPY